MMKFSTVLTLMKLTHDFLCSGEIRLLYESVRIGQILKRSPIKLWNGMFKSLTAKSAAFAMDGEADVRGGHLFILFTTAKKIP